MLSRKQIEDFIKKAGFVKLKVESLAGVSEVTGYLSDDYYLSPWSKSYTFFTTGEISKFISKIDYTFEEIEKVIETN